MEALAAVGLASNILQFIEQSIKLFEVARETYKSADGAPEVDVLLEVDASDLMTVAVDIRENFKSDPAFRKHIQALTNESDEIAAQLINILNDLKVQSDPQQRAYNRKWKSFAQALRRSSKRRDIEDLTARLWRIDKKLKSFISAASLKNQGIILSYVKEIKSQNDQLGAKTTEILDNLGPKIVDMLTTIHAGTSNKNRRQERFESDDIRRQIEEYHQNLEILSYEKSKIERQLSILRSLQFDRIRERKAAIKESHAETFKWAFDQQKTRFPRWLESENGIFWIGGKPGSGKSTLMKFLVDHKHTRSSLMKWAGEKNLIMASHYFWNAGTVMQKSRLGLLQSLLYEVLKELPSLIEVVCGERWNWDTHSHSLAERWNEPELIAAFNILTSMDNLGLKFCFFIDGLDEYTDRNQQSDETFEDLLNTLTRMTSSPFIKICASSRPWTPFVEAFGNQIWQLQVEELTKGDIRRVVTESLGANKRFNILSKTDKDCSDIVEVIVERAKGVFLWVYLVIESLKKGLGQKDTCKELRRRLDQLPSDLQEYFQHMLDSIEPVYWESTSRIFKIMIDSDQALPLIAFDFLDKEIEDPNYALQMSAQPLLWEEISSRYEDLRARLHARGKDLLFTTTHNQQDRLLRYQVDFLHRTVRDFFLDTRAMEKTSKRRETLEFNPLLSLSRIMLALSKSTSNTTTTKAVDYNQLFLFSDSLMYYAWKNEEAFSRNQLAEDDAQQRRQKDLEEVFKILDNLDETHTQRFNSEGAHWTNLRDIPQGRFRELRKKSYLAATIQFRLSLYVRHRIKDDPTQINLKAGRPLLDYALRPTMVTPLQLHLLEGPSSWIVKTLLENGAKPNEKIMIYDNMTPWELFLKTCFEHNSADDRVAIDIEVGEVMLIMITHGADPKCTVEFQGSGDEKQNTRADIWKISRQIGLSSYRMDQIRDAVEKREKESQYTLLGAVTWVQNSLRAILP